MTTDGMPLPDARKGDGSATPARSIPTLLARRHKPGWQTVADRTYRPQHRLLLALESKPVEDTLATYLTKKDAQRGE